MQTKSQYISLETFAEKYSVTRVHIYVLKSNGILPEYIFSSNTRNKLIDELWVIRRYKHKLRILKENEELYYKICDDMNDNKISVYLASKTDKTTNNWRQWMHSRFLTSKSNSVLSFKVNKLQWLFNKYMRMYVRRMK